MTAIIETKVVEWIDGLLRIFVLLSSLDSCRR